MKDPKKICPYDLADKWCTKRRGFATEEIDSFVAGYKAARDAIVAELELVQANKSFSAFVQNPSVESALQTLLDKMEEP